jgi:hypothetical protein
MSNAETSKCIAKDRHSPVLRENEQGSKLWSDVPHETSVVGKPCSQNAEGHQVSPVCEETLQHFGCCSEETLKTSLANPTI